MYDLAKIDFTENLGNRKIRNFPHRDGQDLHIPNQMQFLSQIALTFESKPYRNCSRAGGSNTYTNISCFGQFMKLANRYVLSCFTTKVHYCLRGTYYFSISVRITR